jgi:hypothetical protein
MTKKSFLVLLPTAFLFLSVVNGCDSDKQYKVTGKTPSEKIMNISYDIEAMKWDGPKAMLKGKITDQISRVSNGMKKGVITDSEAEEIVALIETLATKISDMKDDMNGPGGMGGPPGGGMGKPPKGMGKPPEGMEKPSDGNGRGMEIMEFVRLKNLITDLYVNTVTVSAETPAEEKHPKAGQ